MMLGRVVDNIIIQGKEQFRIIGHGHLIFQKSITNGDADTAHGWGYTPALQLGKKNFPWFLHTIKVFPSTALTDETKALGMKLAYNQSTTEFIYPKTYRYAQFESLFAHISVAFDVDLTRFPIRIDPDKEISYVSTNTDSASRTLTIAFMFWITELVKELASEKKK